MVAAYSYMACLLYTSPGDVPPEILGNYSNTEEYALRIKEYLEKYPQFTGVHIPFYVTSDENRNWIVTESDKNRNLELYDELRKLGIIDKEMCIRDSLQ